MKLKNIFRALAIVWLILTVAQHFIIVNSLKFKEGLMPDNPFTIFFLFSLPIVVVILLFIPEDYFKIGFYTVVTALFVSSIVLFYVFVNFQFLYPINISETNNYENYLIFDEIGMDSEVQKIKDIFPEAIPENAENIQYHYVAKPSTNSMYVDAYWELPETEYIKEKTRIIRISTNSVFYDGATYYNIPLEEEYCHIGFDDSVGGIIYFADVNEFCSYTSVAFVREYMNNFGSSSMAEKAE